MVRSLISEITYSVAVPASKRRFFFFAPYLPFQRYLGCYQEAFEIGVVLGYAFRDRLLTFAKLFAECGREEELITFMQQLAHERLAEVGKAANFFEMGWFAEEDRINVNWRDSGIAEADMEHLKKHHEVPLEQALNNLHVAVSTGIGLGSAFPELTERLWKVEHESPMDRDKWEKARSAGLSLPDEPEEPVTLARRQQQLLAQVELFVSRARPELLREFSTQG